ncbi:unnamed protein product [Acanthoscelides obtectus]|uniref:Uncharacterized protein n=2 Tax=Acanthoscelides obtectus TaxID=200917 RepID=A0A9P0P166_ACAOB|nr:unnamed protein product [Acanthoscelides obtectus]CAK1660381.1 15-hydroxyprostaglandin dehydrogenase [NAD(+)] [Acanthoscelides obtectus]
MCVRTTGNAVVLADCDEERGKESEKKLNERFGESRAIFVKTDVSNIDEFENAFNETIKHYDHVDILINNAGILDDSIWEREISVNLNGNIHGLILGMEKFLKTYRQSEEAVIVNISSVCGIECYGFLPVYCSIKLAIIGMTRAWGCPAHYEDSKIRVICLSPGATDTPMMQNLEPVRLIAGHYANTRAGCGSRGAGTNNKVRQKRKRLDR